MRDRSRAAAPLAALVCVVLASCSGSSSGGGATGNDPGNNPGGDPGTGPGDDPGNDGGGATNPNADAGPARALGQSEPGEATYYDATGAGNCSFDATPNDLNVGALNATEYDNAAVCGECLKVDGPNGSVTVRVVDQCPGCRATGGIDLSPQAFQQISPLSAGRIQVTLTLVSCAVTGPLAYRYKDGSSQYWTAIQVQNHKIPITKVEYQTGGNFQEMPRADYNYFIAGSGVGTQASGLIVRVTSIDGQQITDTLSNNFTSTALMQGSSQFK